MFITTQQLTRFSFRASNSEYANQMYVYFIPYTKMYLFEYIIRLHSIIRYVIRN